MNVIVAVPMEAGPTPAVTVKVAVEVAPGPVVADAVTVATAVLLLVAVIVMLPPLVTVSGSCWPSESVSADGVTCGAAGFGVGVENVPPPVYTAR